MDFWKENTGPIRALKRRKLVDMAPTLKGGGSVPFVVVVMGSGSDSPGGMKFWSILGMLVAFGKDSRHVVGLL